MKDAMIFLAKVQKKKNRQICEVLSKLTEEQRRKVYPNLGRQGASLHSVVAGLIGGGVFTLPMMEISSASRETVEKFIGGETTTPMGGVMYLCKSYEEESFETVCADLAEMCEIYVKVFENCTDEELIIPNSMGLPPFDFCLKGMLGQYDTRGQILYILKEEGLMTEEIPDGPLADD